LLGVGLLLAHAREVTLTHAEVCLLAKHVLLLSALAPDSELLVVLIVI
jgi:hypothetical protein